MANIKINDVVISNVNITDCGDLLGLNFTTEMSLAELETLFTPATSPEFRIIDDADKVVGIYKNRKFITMRIDANDNCNIINMSLQVTPAEMEEVEILTNKINEQAMQIATQNMTNEMQASQIAEQANTINVLQDSLNNTQVAFGEAQEALNTTKASLAAAELKIIENETALNATHNALVEAQELNSMLMECVLEMSEVVYA